MFAPMTHGSIDPTIGRVAVPRETAEGARQPPTRTLRVACAQNDLATPVQRNHGHIAVAAVMSAAHLVLTAQREPVERAASVGL